VFQSASSKIFIRILLEISRFVAAIVAQASVLETNSASASGGFHNFDVCSLIFNLLLYPLGINQLADKQLKAPFQAVVAVFFADTVKDPVELPVFFILRLGKEQLLA